MRTIIFIITLLFAITSWGQIQTAITKVKSPVIYENGKKGFIKKGVEIVILSEHIGNNLCEFVHNKKVGKINIDNLVLDKELDNFFFATERMEKAKQIEIEAFNEKAKIITPLILPRLKDGTYTLNGIVKHSTYTFKDKYLKSLTSNRLNTGATVSVFYIHKLKEDTIVGIYNEEVIGFVKSVNLQIDSISKDSLFFIDLEEKNNHLEAFYTKKKEEISSYIKEKNEQRRIALKNERFKKGYLIDIERLYFEMNSAGLLEPYIRITNNSSKDIKYITFNFYWKNGVDDIVSNSINRSETHVSCKLTGYIKAYESDSGSWDSEFYNTTAKSIHISSINIIYRDGSSRTIGSQKCKELTNTYLNSRPNYLND